MAFLWSRLLQDTAERKDPQLLLLWVCSFFNFSASPPQPSCSLPPPQMKITFSSISKGGYPPWSPETNHQYPVECKQVVKTLLMIHSIHPQSKQPRHPECLLYRLPIELLLQIIRLAVDVPCSRMHSFYTTSPIPNPLLRIIFLRFKRWRIETIASTQTHSRCCMGRICSCPHMWVLSSITLLVLLHCSLPLIPLSIRWWGIVFMGWFSWTSKARQNLSSRCEEPLYWPWLLLLSCLLK